MKRTVLTITALVSTSLLLIMTGCSKEPPEPTPPVPIPPVVEPEPEPDDANAIPIIFHVLYEDKDNWIQNPSSQRFYNWIQLMNDFYRAKSAGQVGSTPVNVKFVLASRDPNGKSIDGVHRVKYPSATSLDHHAFLASDHPAGSLRAEIFWDPNKYINVWYFGFSHFGVTGCTHPPYGNYDYPLPGMMPTFDLPPNGQPPTFMYGIAINGSHIFCDGDELFKALCHEMGHYLGLFHAFDYTQCRQPNNDAFDDFCDDTPRYDRWAYEDMVMSYIGSLQASSGNTSFQNNEAAYYKHGSALARAVARDRQCKYANYASIASPTHPNTKITIPPILYRRTSCTGESFASTNIMDYFYGTESIITKQQRDRIEHVLRYSPFIPRPGVVTPPPNIESDSRPNRVSTPQFVE